MSRPFNLDRTVRLLITLAIIAGVIWLIGVLKNVLLPFFLACLLSYILEPFVEFNQLLFKKKRRAPAVFMTLGDGLILIFVLVYFFMPVVSNEITQMAKMFKDYSGGHYAIPFVPEHISTMIEDKLNLNMLIEDFESGKLGSWLDKGESFISASVDFLIHSIEWLLTFIYVIFILLDYERLGKGFALLVPQKYRKEVLQIADDVKIYMNKYFRSQLVIAFCAAVLYCTGFLIVGMPMAILMGILVGILYMIPYFQYVTLIPVIIICYISSLNGLVDFWALFGKCLLVYAVSQSICDYILTPKIMGKTMGMNPALILLSLSIWGTLLGIIGMIIALPLTTLLLVYYRKVMIDHIPIAQPTDLDKELLPVSDYQNSEEK